MRSLLVFLGLIVCGTFAATIVDRTIVVVDLERDRSTVTVFTYDAARPAQTLRAKYAPYAITPGISKFKSVGGYALQCVTELPNTTCTPAVLLSYVLYFPDYFRRAGVPVDADIHFVGSSGLWSDLDKLLDYDSETYAMLVSYTRAYGFTGAIETHTLSSSQELALDWVTVNYFPGTAQLPVLTIDAESARLVYATNSTNVSVTIPKVSNARIFIGNAPRFGFDTAQRTYLRASTTGSTTWTSPCFPNGTLTYGDPVLRWLGDFAASYLFQAGVTDVEGSANMTACLADWKQVVTTLRSANSIFVDYPTFAELVPVLPPILGSNASNTTYVVVGVLARMLSALDNRTLLSYRSDIVPAFAAACAPAAVNWVLVGNASVSLDTRQALARRCMDYAHIRAIVEEGYKLVNLSVAQTDVIFNVRASSTWAPAIAFLNLPGPMLPPADLRTADIAFIVVLSALFIAILVVIIMNVVRQGHFASKSFDSSSQKMRLLKTDARSVSHA